MYRLGGRQAYAAVERSETGKVKQLIQLDQVLNTEVSD